jgi:hypothetical protein
LHAIALATRTGHIRESEAMQGLEQNTTRSIAGERSSGSICAVQSRRQTDDQQARGGRTKARDRQAMVVRILLFLFAAVMA